MAAVPVLDGAVHVNVCSSGLLLGSDITTVDNVGGSGGIPACCDTGVEYAPVPASLLVAT